jgi:1-acyl-sn-glycerol-3-phosphate acyltransferase
MLDIFNIEVRVHGAPVRGARMTVANHVSWLDIPLMSSSELTRFVSKSEVRNWPVAGWLADAAGTFYIQRGKGGARPLLDQLTPHLAAGGSVTIFPEGTTTDGSKVLDFHPRLFAAAIDAGCVVQPVAIRYGCSVDGKNLAPFIGDDDLVSHIWRLLREPELCAQLVYCAPITARGLERDALAAAAQASIHNALALLPVQDEAGEQEALPA